jgi:hypothetical protein
MRVSRLVTPIGSLVAGGASVVCMASMGAMAAASTASATVGMAGMGAATATTAHVHPVTRALQAVGLGGLTHLPNAVMQPLLIVLLLIAIGTALWRAGAARSGAATVLALVTVVAAVGLYASIYLALSDTGYWMALVGLFQASVLSAWSGRRGGAPHVA